MFKKNINSHSQISTIMKNKKYNLLIALLLFPLLAFSQSEIEGLRYSQNYHGGTARFMGMGGAFSAIGGDISALSTNPAGVAVFQKTEFSITPTFFSSSATADYLNSNSSRTDTKYNFNLNNLGLVAAFKSGDNDGWANVNFGVGYNRKNNFNRNLLIEGVNGNSSMLDFFMFNSDGYHPDELWAYQERQAFDTYLIDTIPGQPDYLYGNMLWDLYGETQLKNVETKGSIGEWVFSFGGNYAHKLYVGGTVGVQSINYNMTSIYKEYDANGTIPTFESFTFREYLDTRGTGINFKFGLLFRATEWFRIGGAIHSPTFLSLNEEYDTDMTANYDQAIGGYSSYSSYPTNTNGNRIGPNLFDYEITTPFRAVGGLAFIFPNIGMISADYEYVDYTKIRMRSDTDPFNDVNQYVEDNYAAAHNLRLGGEIVFAPFAIRAGYAYYGSPLKKPEPKEDLTKQYFSGGFGFRSGNFFLDLSYVHTMYSETQYLYDVSADHPYVEEHPDYRVGADIENTNGRVMATIGFKF